MSQSQRCNLIQYPISVPGLLCQSGRRRPENVSILSSLTIMMRTVIVVVTIMMMMLMMMLKIVVNRHTHSNWTKLNHKVLFCSFIIESNRRQFFSSVSFPNKTISVIELDDLVRLLSQFFTFSNIKEIKIVWVVTVFANHARVCLFNLFGCKSKPEYSLIFCGNTCKITHTSLEFLPKKFLFLKACGEGCKWKLIKI